MLAVVTAASVGVFTYVKRGVQARVKSQVDHWLQADDPNALAACQQASPPITDPAVCAQYYGSTADHAELYAGSPEVQLAPDGTPIQSEQWGQRQSRTILRRQWAAHGGGQRTQIIAEPDDRRQQSSRSVYFNRGDLPPTFVMRPRLPDGTLGAGSMGPRSTPAPPRGKDPFLPDPTAPAPGETPDSSVK